MVRGVPTTYTGGQLKRRPIWLVPIVKHHWLGNKTKKTVPIFARCSEWKAQDLASQSDAAQKRSEPRGHLVPDWSVEKLSIDHAILFRTKKCNWGCCSV